MADVRSLLRNERAARRIAHPLASYSTSGKLNCVVCQLQLKTESLWNGHLRSAQHLARLPKYEEAQALENAGPEPTSAGNTPEAENAIPSKKRKMSSDDDQENPHKRSKNGDLKVSQMKENENASAPVMLSAPLTVRTVSPLPTTNEVKTDTVDEDEWAAFEKDIEAATLPVSEEAIISAPAVSAAELAKKTAEETYTERKTRMDAEQEEDREDAARKLEDEFDDMKGFEERVRKLKERRDALRASAINMSVPETVQFSNGTDTDRNGLHSGDEKEESSDEEDDDWDGFRLK